MAFILPVVANVVAMKMNARRQNVSIEKQIPRESLNWPGSLRMRNAWKLHSRAKSRL